jgi:hypothetical protein
MDEDGGDAKKSEAARNREGRVAVYLHRSCLQLVPIAKPDGQNVRRGFDEPARQIEKSKPLLYNSAKTKN